MDNRKNLVLQGWLVALIRLFCNSKKTYPSVDKKHFFHSFYFCNTANRMQKFSLLNSLPLHPQTLSSGLGRHPVDWETWPLSSRVQFPSKLQLCNKVSHHDVGRNRPRNGTEEDKRRGSSSYTWAENWGFLFRGGGGGMVLVLRWVMGVKEKMWKEENETQHFEMVF